MTSVAALPRPKIAISLDAGVLRRLDALVREGAYASRSQAFELALRAFLEKERRTRLARECAKLDPAVEQREADEGLAGDLASWPEY
jgi:metal-responsive CopG/Arc/MetJ family transcriptional regulator